MTKLCFPLSIESLLDLRPVVVRDFSAEASLTLLFSFDLSGVVFSVDRLKRLNSEPFSFCVRLLLRVSLPVFSS